MGIKLTAFSSAAWVCIFWIAVVVINFFGVKGYGEAEFVFSIIKVTAVLGFIILGIIIAAGGVPGSPQGYLGAHYWYDPGAFNHGFKGLCSVFVTAAFVRITGPGYGEPIQLIESAGVWWHGASRPHSSGDRESPTFTANCSKTGLLAYHSCR
jgi:amino acid transporter